jgi:chromosome segregation ATPase
VAGIVQLEMRLRCTQQEGNASSALNEARMRELQTRMQEEADERVRLVQETTAVEVEEIKGRVERQRAEWEEEAAAARAEIGSAAAKLEEAEQFASEHEHRAQELQAELALAQQEHAQQLLKFEQLQMQLDEAEARSLHQEQTCHKQQEQEQALQARARELEAQVAALESAKRMLELQREEQVETIALQRQGMLDSELLKEQSEQLRAELAGVLKEKTRIEREMQSKLCDAKDFEAKLDAAAAESGALQRRCEELRVAHETAWQSKRDLEEQVERHRKEIAQMQQHAAAQESATAQKLEYMASSVQALEQRARQLEADYQRQTIVAEEQQQKIQQLETMCQEADVREADAVRRCKEAERVAREATRSASKELYLVQAQASHLRQQVDALSKDKEAALREKDAALKDKQTLHLTCKQQEDQVSRLTQQVRSLQLRQNAAQDGRDSVDAQGEYAGGGEVPAGGRGGGAAGRGGGAGGASVGGEDEDILQSVIAQRTRRRTLLDSTTKPAPAPAPAPAAIASTWVPVDGSGHASSGAGAEVPAGAMGNVEADSMQVRADVSARTLACSLRP